MSRKQVISSTLSSVVSASLFLMVGCGKQKTESTEKTKKPVAIVKPAKVQTATIGTPSNIAINPSFEESKTFDSGVYKKGKYPKKKPLGWVTKNQILNDFSGWATDEAHSGKRSLKIENIGGSNAYWKGTPIILKEPANVFKAGIWTKTKDIKSKRGRFQLAFDVHLKSDKIKRIYINIPQNNHNWEKTEGKTLFTEDITKIVPYLYFSGMTGTVCFDDFSVCSMNIELSKKKLVFNSNNKKPAFNIRPFYVPINPKNFSDELSAESKALILEEQATIYKVKGSKTIVSRDFIPIEEGKIYKLSGEFKALGEEPSKLYFGYGPYTKSKKFISKQSVNFIEGTETELVRACKPTDKIIFIKNAKNWHAGNINYIAFGIDRSGKYLDLPNFNLSPAGIEKINKSDNCYEIILKKACGKTYPAGTKIREHASGANYIYNAADNSLVNEKWNTFPGFIMSNKFDLSINNCYPKTKYIKLIMLPNNGTPKSTLQFKNIKITSFIIKK